jgi:hypothetical protein
LRHNNYAAVRRTVKLTHVRIMHTRPLLCRQFAGARCRKRHRLLYNCGTFSFTLTKLAWLPDESLHQVREFEKIREPEDRSPLAEDGLGIGRDDIRPVPRHRADMIFVNAQQEPRAVAVVPLAYADKLPSAKRMERVRHAHKTRRCVRRPYILS